jgi:hypothetical protein
MNVMPTEVGTHDRFQRKPYFLDEFHAPRTSLCRELSWIPAVAGRTVLREPSLTTIEFVAEKTYPRSRNLTHTRSHLSTLNKGHELVPRDVSGKSMWGRAEKSVCRGFSACHATSTIGCSAW